MNEGFIAVHVGAGYHSMQKKHAYKTLCKKSCQKNSLLTNAGCGSNLSLSRKVECDASVMDGRTLNFGAVGALSDYMNPVLVAKELLLHQNNENLSLHRIPPCVLVGEGASQWARSRGLKNVKADLLVSENALHTYSKYKRKVEEAENDPRKFIQREPANNKILYSEATEMENNACISSETWLPGDESLMLDTVGAVGMDCCGNVASAVSSGGIVLKHPGRLGQAAMYGCGSWAQNSLSSTEPAVAVTTSDRWIIRSKEEKEKERRKELKELKRKFGLERSNYQTEQSNNVEKLGYQDRAEHRRKTKGSDNPHEKDATPTSMDQPLPSENKGFQILKKMGWSEGQSLGKCQTGNLEPIPIEMRNSKAGLGATTISFTTKPTNKTKQWKKAQQRFLELAEDQASP